MKHAAAGALLVAALLAGPAFAAPQEIPLPSQPPETPVVASGIVDYLTAAHAIIGVLTQKLQLPMPAYIMEVHGDVASFEAGLVRHLQLKPETAKSAAGFAKAAVGGRRIVVNEALLAKSAWPERIVTLSHEMVHATQLELAGHRSVVRYQWLVEGFAEWAAFQVAHELGVRALPAERADMVTRVRTVREKLAPLAQMDTLSQWIETRRERGFDAMYPYAFLAAEFLIERHSYDAVLAYFRRHRVSPDAAAHFEAVFGETLPQFQQALDAHMAKVLR
jgi:hypothetical protein